MRITLLGTMAVLAVGLTAVPASAVTVTFVDLIPDSSRTAFNGFEALPATGTGGPSHTEDGIQVDQVGGDLNGIWTYCAQCFGGTLEGERAWYPNGGDFGYTRITLVGGADFSSVGFRTGSGLLLAEDIWRYYELWDDSALVLSGIYPATALTAGYLGFSGGGFDEIRIRDSAVDNAAFLDGNLNAFAVDSIETAAVPEPGTLLLIGTGLLGLARLRRRVS